MATISNTPRPGYVWDSTDNVWYPIGVGGHGHTDYITQATAISPTTVDAKGDLLVGSAADTIARLAVGNSGEQIVADSSTSSGLRYQASTAAGRNFVINSSFDIWQRGTSFANPNNGYTADRWLGSQAAAGTITRVATGDTTNLPNIQYALRYQRTSASTSTAQLNIIQNFESVNSIPLAGKTVTLSFYARKGANYSPTSSLLGVVLPTGTGTDQNYYTAGYTGSADTINSSATLTTTWQRFTYTATLPVTTTETAVYFYAAPTGTAGAADYYEITGIQLEVGSVATAFSRASGNIQGELAACQRYYYRLGGDVAINYLANGAFLGANSGFALVNNPVSMRIAPTSVDFSTLQTYDYGAPYNLTNVTILTASKLAVEIETTQAGSGTTYRPFVVRTNSINGYLGFSGEL